MSDLEQITGKEDEFEAFISKLVSRYDGSKDTYLISKDQFGLIVKLFMRNLTLASLLAQFTMTYNKGDKQESLKVFDEIKNTTNKVSDELYRLNYGLTEQVFKEMQNASE